jgi:transcriptional regulator
MYIPDAFKVVDSQEVDTFLEKYDFATLVSFAGDGLIASHIPVIATRGPFGIVIRGHVARGNSHWTLMDGKTDSIAIFHGPHGYVSPTWYSAGPAVPTWNYP